MGVSFWKLCKVNSQYHAFFKLYFYLCTLIQMNINYEKDFDGLLGKYLQITDG